MPVTYRLINHRNKNCILVCFPADAVKNKRMMKVQGSLWSKTWQGWLIPDTRENRQKCKLESKAENDEEKVSISVYNAVAPKPVIASANMDLCFISAENRAELQKFREMLTLKRYSSSTIRTYCSEFIQLLKRLKHFPVKSVTPDLLMRYMLLCAQQGLSEHTMHSRLNALKFYFEQVLKRDKFFFTIPRPKKPVQLPKVLSKEAIAAIICSISNLKHKTIIMLAYGCGLRVSEITRLRIKHIDGSRRTLLIERAKGKKDRMVNLSPTLLIILREYYRHYKPVDYLFEGQCKGQPYSIRSLETIIQQAKKRAGVRTPGSMHALRHSFATHLLDQGKDVTLIQKLLGHNDIKTTMRYLHVTNRDLVEIISPIEEIKTLIQPAIPVKLPAGNVRAKKG